MMSNSILKNYPSNKRLYKSSDSTHEGWLSNSCIFGVAHHHDSLPSIDRIPAAITSFYSFFAEGSVDLLSNLIENGINNHLEHLTIGYEHSNVKYGYKDYSKISELLASTKFPKLKSFEYGIDFLLANEEQYYPHLGDITKVLANMPLLEELDLSGSFELREKIDLKNIKNLCVIDFYTEISNGIISKETLNYLTESNFENLEEFEVSVTANNDLTYHLNESIFTNHIEKLKCVAIDGRFEKGTKDKLITILKPHVEKLFLDEIEEDE